MIITVTNTLNLFTILSSCGEMGAIGLFSQMNAFIGKSHYG